MSCLPNDVSTKLKNHGIFFDFIENNSFLIIFNELTMQFKFKSSIDFTLEKTNETTFQTELVIEIMNKSSYKTTDEFYSKLADVITNLKSYCIGCGEKLQVKSNVYATCGDIVCSYKLEELILDNDVTDFIKGNYEIFKFHINTTIQTVNSPEVLAMLDPFPNHFLKSEYKNELVKIKKKRGSLLKLQLSATEFEQYNKAKDIPAIKNILNGLDLEKIKKDIIDSYPSDPLMAEKLGKSTYLLLRFIIKSCCLDLTKDSGVSNLSIYKITHPFYVENQFAKKVETESNTKSYLFHGSSSHCWYSILRNGIKVLSNTSMQKNGAAHGSGIYTSDNYQFASGYANITGTSNNIVGVYEVVGPKINYVTRNIQIYVIPTHELCLLRYLIVGKPENPMAKSNGLKEDIQDDVTRINNYFSSKLGEIKLNDTAKMKTINNKKLMAEYKKLTSSIYQIKLVDSNILDWEVTWSGVTLAFKFPQLFPFEPPFVFVKLPKFKPDSTNITVDGAICCDHLTKSNWLPAISIENLIVQIFSLIIEPNLSNILNQGTYNEEKAVQSYEKLAKGNGWF